MNSPVSFEIAKLLKEKGWKNKTLNFYFEDGELKENVLKETIEMDYGSEYEIEFSELIENWNDGFLTKKDGNRCFGCQKSKGYMETFSAPTIAEVKMWIYQNYSIWISIHFNAEEIEEEGIFWGFELSDTEDLNQITQEYSYDFKKPEDAYVSAIEYILKNLI